MKKIVIDMIDNKLLPYAFYRHLWEERGHNRDDFNQYLQDIQYAKSLTEQTDFNVVKASNQAKEFVKDRKSMLTFTFLPAEKQIILKAEDLGRIKKGEVIRYDGYDREIRGIDYMRIPKEADAFVIFSGHPGAAKSAVKAWYNDYRINGKPKKLVFLGLHDNQGNTDFSRSDLKFNVRSEVEMYVRFFKRLGVPKRFIKECLVTPKDVSTADNIELLAEIRNRFFDKKKDTNFVMFAYPAYQKRIASEFAYGFQKLEDSKRVAGTNFMIPDAPVSQNEKDRYMSYDNLNGIASDIIIGNCAAHIFRTQAGGRFDSKLGAYPSEFKPLIALSLAYSYPNVPNELAGTDPKVAAILKIHRAMQHKVAGWEDPKHVDDTIKRCANGLSSELVKEGLVNNDILSKQSKASPKELATFFEKQKARG